PHVGLAGDVGPHEQAVAAGLPHLPHRLLALLLPPAGDHHVGPLAGERHRRRPADPRAAAGHQGHFPRERCHDVAPFYSRVRGQGPRATPRLPAPPRGYTGAGPNPYSGGAAAGASKIRVRVRGDGGNPLRKVVAMKRRPEGGATTMNAATVNDTAVRE